MSREWKPGDVAMVNDCTRPERPWELATCIAAKTPQRETTWRLHKNGGEVWGSVSDARPLVVIDPEDREQVEAFGRLYLERDRVRYDLPISTPVADDFFGDMQAALREFANPTPPKPDEPMGLGAVIEDEKDRKWVRGDGDTIGWTHAGDWRHYEEINAVRILSEGFSDE